MKIQSNALQKQWAMVVFCWQHGCSKACDMKFKALSSNGTVGIFPIGRRSPYANAGEYSKHRLYIKNLADETHRSELEITPLYEGFFAYFKANAKVHDYLPILVSKKVKECLKSGIGIFP